MNYEILKQINTLIKTIYKDIETNEKIFKRRSN